MANRFPLIIDSATNRIVELPATDNLDLAGSNISSVANITAGNSVSANFFVGSLYGTANIALVAIFLLLLHHNRRKLFVFHTQKTYSTITPLVILKEGIALTSKAV